jgi:hypothetical protein
MGWFQSAHHLTINRTVRNSIARLPTPPRALRSVPGEAVQDVRARFHAAIAAVLFFSGAAARAETLTQTLEAFGFFGRWAMDCSQAPSPENTVRTARVSPTGDPIFSESLGGQGEPNTYVILRAKRTSADTITLRIKLNGEYQQDLTMHRQGDQLRTLSNREVDTRVYVVRKGIIAATKQATPWLTRCEQQQPSRQQG